MGFPRVMNAVYPFEILHTPGRVTLIIEESSQVRRIWLADPDTLKIELTLTDPEVFARPWTVAKTYRRGRPGAEIMEYVRQENNRNPILPDGSTGVILAPQPE